MAPTESARVRDLQDQVRKLARGSNANKSLQIHKLEAKLHALHATDTNKLKRQQRSVRQHAMALLAEARAAQAVANRLDGHAPAFTGEKISKEAAKSIGALWLGALAAYYLKSAFKLGRQMSRAVLALSLVSASVPLGVKASRRLRNLVLKNPRVVDEVKAALAVVEQRAVIMEAVAAPEDVEGSAVMDAATAELQQSSGSEDMVHVSADDALSPTRGQGARGVAMLAPRGSEGSAVAEVAEAKAGQQGTEVAEVSSDSGGGSGAVSHTVPEPPPRRGWSFSSTKS